MIWAHTCAIPEVKTPCRECEAEASARAEPAECPEGAIGIFNSDAHGGCPCRQTGQHHVHRCMHGTEWWKRPPTEDASGPAGPGEGGGTGAGEREAHRAAEGAMDAARCSAHGRTVAEHTGAYGYDCTMRSPDCQCGMFEATGMHWDTCPGRGRRRDTRDRIARDMVPAEELHDAKAAAVEQFTAALLTGLDDLERDDHHGTLVRPGDVADLVHRVAAEVRGG